MNDLDRFQLYGDLVMAVLFAILGIVCFFGGCKGNIVHFVFCGACVLVVYLMVVEILDIKRKNG